MVIFLRIPIYLGNASDITDVLIFAFVYLVWALSYMLILIIEIMIYDTVWVFILSIINRRIRLHLDLRLVIVHEFDMLISLVWLQFAIGAVHQSRRKFTSKSTNTTLSVLYRGSSNTFSLFQDYYGNPVTIDTTTSCSVIRRQVDPDLLEQIRLDHLEGMDLCRVCCAECVLDLSCSLVCQWQPHT